MNQYNIKGVNKENDDVKRKEARDESPGVSCRIYEHNGRYNSRVLPTDSLTEKLLHQKEPAFFLGTSSAPKKINNRANEGKS